VTVRNDRHVVGRGHIRVECDEHAVDSIERGARHQADEQRHGAPANQRGSGPTLLGRFTIAQQRPGQFELRLSFRIFALKGSA
jgi:hypothetical protein